MKKLECYIRPEKIEMVKTALFDKGIKGMSITEVKGHGNQRGIRLIGRTGEYCVEWIPKLKLEIVIPDTKNVEEIINAIIDSAKTGKEGDGKIFITPIENAIRIRTKEQGEKIL